MGSHHVLCPMSYSVHGVWPVPSSSTIMSCVLFSTCILARPFQLDHHVLCPIQWMEAGQPVSSRSTIMSYVLFSGWSLASQSLPARPSCPMSCSVHGVWPASLFLLDHYVLRPVMLSTWSLAGQTLQLDHHVLCPVQCMELGQSVPFLLDHHVLCPMSCPLQGVKALEDQGNAAD